MQVSISLSGKRISLILGLLASLSLAAGDWPQFRGPSHDGISVETDWNRDWNESRPDIAWRAEVGIGFSAFAVAGGQALTMGHKDGHEVVTSLDEAGGEIRWTHRFPSDLGAKFYIGGPGSTPTIDSEAGRVHVLGKWGDVFCLDLEDGKVLWKRQLVDEEELKIPDWGFNGSPLLWKDRVLLNCGRSGLALDRETGSTVWRSDGSEAGYSTPLPIRQGDEEAVVFSSGEGYSAAMPDTGEVLWTVSWNTRYGVNAADPIVVGDQVFVSSGYGKGSGLFPLGRGRLSARWTENLFRAQQNAPVRIGDHLYGIDGNSNSRAKIKCLDWKSGEILWEEDSGYGALSASGPYLVYILADGTLGVAKADPERFMPLSTMKVLERDCWTVPVLANGRIFCRNSKGSAVAVDVRRTE